MKSILLLVLFSLVSPFAHSATPAAEKAYQTAFESLNQDIQQELLYGDLTNKSVVRSLKAKINQLAPLAKQVGGRKHSLMVVMSFHQTLNALAKMNKNYRAALDMTYANGLTGREIILEASNPITNAKILKIYQEKKESLSSLYSDRKLQARALDLTLAEIENDPDFAFLKMEPSDNYVQKSGTFSFLKEKCVPDFGEEDFFLLLFGFNRCHTPNYRVDRYTVGLGYYYAYSGYAYVTGLKIGKKNFYGVGAKVQIGVIYGGGIGIFLGNGLMLSLDLEKAYGIYAGATYINLKRK